MFRQIIGNEWRLWRRDNRTVWLLATMTILSLLALGLQLGDTVSKLAQRKSAQQASRAAWLSQGEKHPHLAAHFGNYAYKQPSALAVFDPGLSPYTGTSVYMEPHRQNDFLLNESGERDTGARFGWFTPAFVCQFILPLLIVLLSFNLVVSDKQSGVYALFLAQGASTRVILFAKAAAVFLLFAGFLTAYLLLGGLLSAMAIHGHFPFSSFIYLWLVYLAFYAVWCGAGICVSALAKTPGASISVLLIFWIISGVVLPKWAASAAEDRYPLMTNYAFRKKVSEDIANGLNGHDVASDRAKRLEDSVIKAEGVDSVQHLKFNFEGYLMERGEEYSSRVYDVHFNTIHNELESQRKVQSLFALASPAMLLRNLSMAASNANLESELRFQQDAENYRRGFVQKMNEDMMYHSKWGADSWDHYKVKKSLYSNIHDFTAPMQPLRWRLQYARVEQAGLLFWLLAVTGIMIFISRRNSLN